MSASQEQSRYSRSGELGFTLVEILTTITIMGILFAIATASWQSVIESRRVDSATNQVAADLRLANSTATSRLGVASIKFNSDGTQVSCTNAAGVAADADYCLYQPTASGIVQKPRQFESDIVKLTSPNLIPTSWASSIEFTANGTASAPGTLGVVAPVGGAIVGCPASTPSTPPVARMRITAGGNQVHCITFNAATSRIKID